MQTFQERKKERKHLVHKIVSMGILFAMLFISASNSTCYALSTTYEPTQLNTNTEYEFVYPNNESIKYYLDENLNPYQIINDQKVTILLPLEHLRVYNFVNPTTINTSYTKSFNSTHQFAAPSGAVTTFPYSQNVAMSAQSYFTPAFYVGRTSTAWFSTSSHSPFYAKKINVGFSYYDSINNVWQSYQLKTAIDCTSTPLKCYMAPFDYIKFSFNQYETVNSLTYTVKKMSNI